MRIEPLNFRRFDLGSDALTLDSTAPTSEPAPPPPPSFTLEDLEMAEKAAYHKGHAQGLEDGQKQSHNQQTIINEQIDRMLDSLLGKLNPLLGEQKKFSEQQQALLPQLAYAIAEKIAGVALDKNAIAIVEDTTMRAYTMLAGEPRLCITVEESLLEPLEKRLTARLVGSQEETDIILQGDASMPMGDCRIEWKNGVLSRTLTEIKAASRQVVDTLTLTHLSTPENPEHTQTF